MKLLNKKYLAAASALVLGVAAFGSTAQAQTTVNATFTTSSGITVLPGNTMDFGTYLLQVGGGDNPTLTLSDDGSNAVVVANNPNSQIIEITAPATEGSVTVDAAANGTELTMTRDAASTVDFVDTGLSLTAVTYRTATETGNIDADGDTGTVTVVTAGTPETVTFGGVITATATPADTTHAASFTVSFAL